MTAVYAGSFDPFTNGHLDILLQAADVFDYVYVVLATNTAKSQRYIPKADMKQLIEDLVDQHCLTQRVKVVEWNGFLVDFCAEYGCDYIVRGLRNDIDYSYEENIAKINQRLNPHVLTMYFRARPQWETCSSSLVRELWNASNIAVRDYLPESIHRYLIKQKS